MEQNDVAKMAEAILTQANETFDSIKAVKGEKYLDTVKAVLNTSSFNRLIARAIMGEVPPAVGLMMLHLFAHEHIAMVCDANGVEFDDELANWVDTIEKNSRHTGELARADRGDTPLQ